MRIIEDKKKKHNIQRRGCEEREVKKRRVTNKSKK